MNVPNQVCRKKDYNIFECLGVVIQIIQGWEIIRFPILTTALKIELSKRRHISQYCHMGRSYQSDYYSKSIIWNFGIESFE